MPLRAARMPRCLTNVQKAEKPPSTEASVTQEPLEEAHLEPVPSGRGTVAQPSHSGAGCQTQTAEKGRAPLRWGARGRGVKAFALRVSLPLGKHDLPDGLSRVVTLAIRRMNRQERMRTSVLEQQNLSIIMSGISGEISITRNLQYSWSLLYRDTF